MESASRAEALLRLSEHTSDLFCTVGLDGHFKYMNPACEKFFGATFEELKSRPARELLYPQQEQDVSLEPGAPVVRHESRFVGKDGSVRWLEWTMSTATEEQLIFCVARDVTEQKRIAEELRASEARYRFLTEHSIDMIGRFDLEGRVIDFSDAVQHVLGFNREELIGRNAFELVHPDDRAAVSARMAMIFEGGTYSLQYRLQKKTGEYVWVESRGWAVRDPVTQAPQELVGVTRDIGERRLSEEKQKALEQQLSQGQKMEAIGRLAGGIAHDFNNLLSAILGFTVVALDSLPADAPERSNLEEVIKAGQRAAELVKQLLIFSRRQTTSTQSAIDVNDSIRELHRMIGRVIGEHVEIELDLRAKDARVRIDASQLSQVLINLCVNARDAMPRGGRVRVETQKLGAGLLEPPPDVEPSPLGWMLITVSDNGAGMSEEVRAHVFEPFFTTKSHGTGLGLAAVYGVVRGAGGFIDLSSEIGKGTRFDLYFPLSALPVVASPLRLETVAPSRGQTILVAEDEDLVREVVRKVLARAHYRVLTARNGKEALEVLDHTPAIDLLVTDAVMPLMGGNELIEHVYERWPNLPVLLISGYDAESSPSPDRRVCSLPKPFTPSELTGAVRELLEAKS